MLTATARPEAPVACGQGVERGETGGRLHLASLDGAVFPQRANELVDLAHGLAGDLLDRLERDTRPCGVLLLQQAGGAGLDEDHVDRVAGRVVEVAGDAGALLGDREAAFALGVPLRSQRALLQLGDARAALAEPVADHPRAAPNERSGEERDDGEPASTRRIAAAPTWTTNSPTTVAAVSRSPPRV